MIKFNPHDIHNLKQMVTVEEKTAYLEFLKTQLTELSEDLHDKYSHGFDHLIRNLENLIDYDIQRI